MQVKRKAPEPAQVEAAGPASAGTGRAMQSSVDPRRVRELRSGEQGPGPVLYWMTRDQRSKDNWALLHAVDLAAKKGVPVAVVFNLVTAYMHAGARQFGFMVRGLQHLEQSLGKLHIPFFLLKGDPVENIPRIVRDAGAGALITDFGPLRLGRQWRAGVVEKISIPFYEVDAHNVVPVWIASDKRESAARTIRPKITRLLPEFLVEYPELRAQTVGWTGMPPPRVDWDGILEEVVERGRAVPEITWCTPGEDAAWQALCGKGGFLTDQRLKKYKSFRNDPAIPEALSGLSPFIHFGQLSAQRAALEARKHRGKHKESVDCFLEELIIRRELADNFCHYEPEYDNHKAAANWALESLKLHQKDKREFTYTEEEWEKGKTHDKLWNASQLELIYGGKMHGFMRMYWAKKILEWSNSAEEALKLALYLNDKYEIDGRDPNGVVGCMWAIYGIHDQGWTERAVFGKIRYMNYNGCKRKFDIEKYIARVEVTVREARKAHGKVQPKTTAVIGSSEA
uniref:Deoxyribodipyrimidine photo-lyase n=2 Tax=Auxenochlorella protothecoides TaxID=3075 RepID=A0A1D1ZTS8_AUXPR